MQQPNLVTAKGYVPPHDTRADNEIVRQRLNQRAVQRAQNGGYLPGEAPAQAEAAPGGES